MNTSNFDFDRFAIFILLFFEVSPFMISTSLFATPKDLASNLINSAFAAPSTGGDEMRIFNEPSCGPTILLLEDRGTTRTSNNIAPSFSVKSIFKQRARVPI